MPTSNATQTAALARFKNEWSALATFDDASALLRPLTDAQKRARLYLAGDYWQGKTAWVGPLVPVGTPGKESLDQDMERAFTPRPIIEEVVERHLSGVLGQEPAFEFVSTRASGKDAPILEAYEKIRQILRERDERLIGRTPVPALPDPNASENAAYADARDQLELEETLHGLSEALGLASDDEFEVPADILPEWKAAIEQARALKKVLADEAALIAEVNAGFALWWDRRRGHEILQEFARTLLGVGRATLRFYVPGALLDDSGQVKVDSWQQALEMIWLESSSPSSASVARDTRMQPASLFSYMDVDDRTDDKKEVARLEVTFIKEGVTVVRIVQDEEVVDEVEHDCAGELFVDEATIAALISSAVQRNQNALNVINTMLLHNGNLAGFRERNYLNAQRPTKRVADASQPGGYREEPDAVSVGARAANFLNGFVLKDREGNETMVTPSIVITDPVSPEPLIEAIEKFEENILGAVSQKHVLISGDATASAVSRIQARHEHVNRLQGTAVAIEGVLRSRMRGIVAFAMTLARDTTKLEAFKNLRPFVKCQIDAGPITPDERTAILAEYNDGIRSLESTQILLGIEDVDGEAQKLERERAGSLPQLQDRAAAVETLTRSGAGIEGAAEVAGFSPGEAAKLAEGDFVENGGETDGE